MGLGCRATNVVMSRTGKVLPGNDRLLRANKNLQLQDEVQLSDTQRTAVREAILKEAIRRRHNIHAVCVRATHIHVVVGRTMEATEKIVACYKTAGRLALKGMGCTGKVWTRGYDKKFSFDQASLRRRIEYVQGQNPA